MIEAWEVEKFGRDSFGDPDAISLYGMRPAEWYAKGVRLLARTTLEAVRDPLGEHRPGCRARRGDCAAGVRLRRGGLLRGIGGRSQYFAGDRRDCTAAQQGRPDRHAGRVHRQKRPGLRPRFVSTQRQRSVGAVETCRQVRKPAQRGVIDRPLNPRASFEPRQRHHPKHQSRDSGFVLRPSVEFGLLNR